MASLALCPITRMTHPVAAGRWHLPGGAARRRPAHHSQPRAGCSLHISMQPAGISSQPVGPGAAVWACSHKADTAAGCRCGKGSGWCGLSGARDDTAGVSAWCMWPAERMGCGVGRWSEGGQGPPRRCWAGGCGVLGGGARAARCATVSLDRFCFRQVVASCGRATIMICCLLTSMTQHCSAPWNSRSCVHGVHLSCCLLLACMSTCLLALKVPICLLQLLACFPVCMGSAGCGAALQAARWCRRACSACAPRCSSSTWRMQGQLLQQLPISWQPPWSRDT